MIILIFIIGVNNINKMQYWQKKTLSEMQNSLISSMVLLIKGREGRIVIRCIHDQIITMPYVHFISIARQSSYCLM